MNGYELWDTESGNLLDDFDTEAHALGTVAELLAVNEAGSAESLALVRVDGGGRSTTIAMGQELADLAQSVSIRRPA